MAISGDYGRNSLAPAARVCGVSKRYNGVLAVNDVSFEVAHGELLTLLGPSGCGKTTTMRSIAGLEKITDGEIFLNDRVVSSAPQRIHLAPEKRDVGMVFQSYAIWPHMNVFENVAYPLRCRKVARDEIQRRVHDGLRMVEMEEFADRPATKLSGGQQQRVALARSMVMQPSVLLLDEPLCNLDAKLRGQMRMHIKKLQQQTGLAMIYVTHDQVEAMALSDRIIVMKDGVVEQVGSPEEIYEQPKTEFVADFVGAINFIWGEVEEVRPEDNLLRISTGGDSLTGVLNGNDRPRVGARVLVIIRPEKVCMVPAGLRKEERHQGPEMNSVNARVTMSTYCGDRREYDAAGTDFSIRVLTPNTTAFGAGAEVRLEFAAADLHLLQG